MSMLYRDIGSGIDRPRNWQSLAEVRGHTSPVTAIAQGLRPGADIVSGGYDGYVLCWDHEIREPRWSIRFADLVNAVSVNGSERRIAVAVADGFVYVLDAATGFVLHRLGPHADDVNDVAWDPQHRDKIAVVCDAGDTSIYVWDIAVQEPTRATVGQHEHGVFAIAYSPSGELLASASEDRTVRLWNVASGAEVATLMHPGDVETLAWSPDGQVLGTGCDDSRLRLWGRTAVGWSVRSEMTDATASVRCVRFSPSGKYVASGSYDGTLRLYLAHSGELVQNWSGTWQWERSCVVPNDESVIVGTFGDRPIRYSIAAVASTPKVEAESTITLTAPLVYPTWGLNALSVGAKSGVVVATDCGFVAALEDEGPLLRIDTLVTCVAAKPGQDEIAVTDYLGRVFLIRPSGPRHLAAANGGPLNAVTWLDDRLVTGGYDGVLRLWSHDGTQIAAIVAHDAPVKSVAWSPVSRCVITGSSDNTVASWRVDDNGFTLVARLAEPELVLVNAVDAPAARPWVAVGSRDRRIRLWLPDGSRPSTVLPLVHQKSVKAIAVHSRGDLIVSGSYDGTLCFWRLDEDDGLLAWRQERLHGKPGVSKVCIGADTVYSVGWDGTVGRWSLNAELLEHFVPAPQASVGLTSANWRQP